MLVLRAISSADSAPYLPSTTTMRHSGICSAKRPAIAWPTDWLTRLATTESWNGRKVSRSKASAIERGGEELRERGTVRVRRWSARTV